VIRIDKQKTSERRLLFLTTSFGFFTASYSLFATNVTSAALAYVYWPKNHEYSHILDVVTLITTILGMLIFGHLADRWGRKTMYGVELILIIVSTLSLAQASSGYQGSMQPIGWVIFWRMILGFGIGAEYPTTAVILAELSPRRMRGRMMAIVFAMQPLGQVTAYAVCACVLSGSFSGSDSVLRLCAAPAVDKVWRTVVGVGAAPALISIILRYNMFESVRWTMVTKNVQSEEEKSQDEVIDRIGPQSVSISETNGPDNRSSMNSEGLEHDDDTQANQNGPEIGVNSRQSSGAYPKNSEYISHAAEFKYKELIDYLCTPKAKRRLLLVSLCWCILDIGFYGIALDSSSVLQVIWNPYHALSNTTLSANFNLDLQNPDVNTSLLASCREAHLDSSVHSANLSTALSSHLSQEDLAMPFKKKLLEICLRNILTSSVGGLTGSIILVLGINRIPRAKFMAITFLLVAAMFLITGILLIIKKDSKSIGKGILILYALIECFFNLGPNTLIWIMPSEIFPTKYRGTLYGISGAIGKLGALFIQSPKWKTDITSKGLGTRFCAAFFPIMVLGGLLAFGTPEVQILQKQRREEGDETVYEPKSTRTYPLFGKYSNLPLETIVEDLDGRHELDGPPKEETEQDREV
jgi:PHS family inorganic phosphate transporter-like MFS transporter